MQRLKKAFVVFFLTLLYMPVMSVRAEALQSSSGKSDLNSNKDKILSSEYYVDSDGEVWYTKGYTNSYYKNDSVTVSVDGTVLTIDLCAEDAPNYKLYHGTTGDYSVYFRLVNGGGNQTYSGRRTSLGFVQEIDLTGYKDDKYEIWIRLDDHCVEYEMIDVLIKGGKVFVRPMQNTFSEREVKDYNKLYAALKKMNSEELLRRYKKANLETWDEREKKAKALASKNTTIYGKAKAIYDWLRKERESYTEQRLYARPFLKEYQYMLTCAGIPSIQYDFGKVYGYHLFVDTGDRWIVVGKEPPRSGTGIVDHTNCGFDISKYVLAEHLRDAAYSANGFKDYKTDISYAVIECVKSKTYTGAAIKPFITVRTNGYFLTKETDYTVSYKKNLSVGTATIVVTGKGDFKGTVTKTFRVVPKGTTIKAVAAGKGTIKVTWKKQTEKMKISGVNGYQLQYSRKASFENAKVVTVKGQTSISKTIKGLASGKKYYVRIRTYKAVGGVKYYSGWSSAKTIMVK